MRKSIHNVTRMHFVRMTHQNVCVKVAPHGAPVKAINAMTHGLGRRGMSAHTQAEEPARVSLHENNLAK